MRSLKDDLRLAEGYIRSEGQERNSDFRYLVGGLAAGFVLQGGMLIAGYLLLAGRIDQVSASLGSKVETLSNGQTRIETKLDDLIQRIPPVQQPPTKR